MLKMNEDLNGKDSPKTFVEGFSARKEDFIIEPETDPEDIFDGIKDSPEALNLFMYALYGDNGPAALREQQGSGEDIDEKLIDQAAKLIQQYKTGGEIYFRIKPYLDKIQENEPDLFPAYNQAAQLLRRLR